MGGALGRFLKARELQMERPWGRDHHLGANGELCMAGAHIQAWCDAELTSDYQFFAQSAALEILHPEDFDLLNGAASDLFPERATDGRVSTFNDHEDTTLQDVMAVWDEVILRAKEAAAHE